MRFILENENLRLEAESFGAELKSLVRKSDGREYLWSGDPAYWGKTAPLLFPFIGKLQDESYTYRGRVYPMDKHGFGQRVDYEVAGQEADRIRFVTADSEKTREKYPFSFRLEVEYVLLEDGVRENWYVTDTGKEPLYFSVGGHGAFACPPAGLAGQGRTGCQVKLYGAEEKECLYSLRLDKKGLITSQLLPVGLKDGRFVITEDLFAGDALIFDREGITAAALCDPAGREYVRVECGCPVWGIWSHPDPGASYVCLEPWYGICDFAGFEGELPERPHTYQALPGQTWTGGNTVRLVETDLKR